MPVFALVDCNNFYVSCERVFRPDLNGKPVAVLSNNDGCIVARSAEVKALGIKMGVPLFQIQHLVKQHQITLFSSNYTLYADMSARVMSILESFVPALEVYSIDEAFLDLTGFNSHDPSAYAQLIKKTVGRNTGIPVCVGIAPTKTLAKLANFAAKKWLKTGGVVDLSNPQRRAKLMPLVPVNEVWGVGARTAEKLRQLGIYTVMDLAQQAPQAMQKHGSIVLARIVRELNGQSCLALEEIAPPKQQIVCSRSFSHKLTSHAQLAQALAEFCSRAAEKLRQQHALASCITIFIRTNPHAVQDPQYQRQASSQLSPPTQDTRILIKTAHQLLDSIFKPGFSYAKCGVQLSHIQAAQQPQQLNLFDLDAQETQQRQQQLMQTIDRINKRYPKALSIAATGFNKSWQPKSDKLSRRYTTNWQELLIAK